MRIFEGVAKTESVAYASGAVIGLLMIGFGAALALN
jgi:hypothetical protein